MNRVQREYRQFLNRKKIEHKESGFEIDISDINPILKEHQKLAVKWHLKMGKSYNGFDVGLGKSPVQLEFSNIINRKFNKPVLILTPLAVSYQMKKEAVDIFDFDKNTVKVVESDSDVINGINITNYEKIDKFDSSKFVSICLDESSIIKSFNGKFKNKLFEFSKDIEYKLSLSATASPNDYTEIGNQAEFLDIMKHHEMLSMFFINGAETTSRWRLKHHAKKDFYKWLSSWGLIIKKPSDIGCSDDGYILPKHNIIDCCYDQKDSDLFNSRIELAKGINQIRRVNKETLEDRCLEASKIINNSKETFLCWCNLNDESKRLKQLINDSVEIKGSDSIKHKEKSLMDFLNGKIKCLITKPSIAGYGMNFQYVCNNAVYVGLNYSFENFYQSRKRLDRFGQIHEVNSFIIYSEREGEVIKSIKEKENNFDIMHDEMKKYINIKEEFDHSMKNDKEIKFNEVIFPKFLKEN